MRKYQLTNEQGLDVMKVKMWMLKRGVTGRELAGHVGVNESVFSRTIHGTRRNPKIQQAIADALGVKLSEVIQSPEKNQAV